MSIHCLCFLAVKSYCFYFTLLSNHICSSGPVPNGYKWKYHFNHLSPSTFILSKPLGVPVFFFQVLDMWLIVLQLLLCFAVNLANIVSWGQIVFTFDTILWITYFISLEFREKIVKIMKKQTNFRWFQPHKQCKRYGTTDFFWNEFLNLSGIKQYQTSLFFQVMGEIYGVQIMVHIRFYLWSFFSLWHDNKSPILENILIDPKNCTILNNSLKC